MSTPHNGANRGDFAKTVLMPGDPLRAKYIAEKFLTESKLVNEVRGMLAYTGLYQNRSVSVMASGMGNPSMGIYSHELFEFYDVDNIIRIGTAGAISDRLKLRDVVLAMSSATNSNYAQQFRLPGTPAPTASYPLLKLAEEKATHMGKNVVVGSVFSSDTFYDDANSLAEWGKLGVLAVEMESAALYFNAARANKNALCICTISDCPLTGEACSAEERQTTFDDMIVIALETAIELK